MVNIWLENMLSLRYTKDMKMHHNNYKKKYLSDNATMQK